MKLTTIVDRIEEMEAEVTTLREWGADAQADTLKRACDRFRAIITEWLDEPLNVGQATEECPWWEARTIAGKLRSGDLQQAGAHGAPLVLRRDLFGVSDDAPSEFKQWAEDLIDG